jgi:hypothetical protein
MVIIDNIDSDDKKTLIACSMSCKAFIGPTYRRLYCHIYLRKSVRALQFARTISSLDSPGRYVRRLFMICDNLMPTHHMNSIIPILAQSLPGLISLHLVGLTWRDLNQQAQSTLKAGFRSIQQLELRVQFDTDDQMLGLISSFPFLTHLGPVICSVYGHLYAPIPYTLILLPSGLEVLDIFSDHISIFDRLLRLQKFPNLRNLRISISVGAHRIHEFGSLLEFLGPNLESLTFYGLVDTMWQMTMHDPTSINGLSFSFPFLPAWV